MSDRIERLRLFLAAAQAESFSAAARRLSVSPQGVTRAVQALEKELGEVLFHRNTRNVRLSECPSFGKPILLYDIKSKGCESYLALANEIMRRERSSPDRHAAA